MPVNYPSYGLEFPTRAPSMDFSQGFGSYNAANPGIGASAGGVGGAGAGGGFLAAAAPWLGPVGLGLQGLGLASSLYGTYKQGQQAKREHGLAVKRYEADMERQAREDARNAEIDAMRRQQQDFEQTMLSGKYAQGLSNDAMDRYGSYARSIGI